jgi:hypothetical protein
MGQFHSRLYNIRDATPLGDLFAPAAANDKLAQVLAALQPYRPEVLIQSVQGCAPAHLHIQPELRQSRSLYPKMIQ